MGSSEQADQAGNAGDSAATPSGPTDSPIPTATPGTQTPGTVTSTPTITLLPTLTATPTATNTATATPTNTATDHTPTHSHVTLQLRDHYQHARQYGHGSLPAATPTVTATPTRPITNTPTATPTPCAGANGHVMALSTGSSGDQSEHEWQPLGHPRGRNRRQRHEHSQYVVYMEGGTIDDGTGVDDATVKVQTGSLSDSPIANNGEYRQDRWQGGHFLQLPRHHGQHQRRGGPTGLARRAQPTGRRARAHCPAARHAPPGTIAANLLLLSRFLRQR